MPGPRCSGVSPPHRPAGYILDLIDDPPQTSTFRGETFRVLKERETKQYGEYRARRLVLAAWDGLEVS